eukprot:PLAT11642.13.p1 GENE.PLAT11642.13~~PLAT11642.13.p1  ORF type:complete len:850 (+),score=362.94 PLAT11642.13:648-3197(+)
MDTERLLRCSPDFLVIALGLPVPPYPGKTLDPPLRSRFQARNVGSADIDTLMRLLSTGGLRPDTAEVKSLLALAQGMTEVEFSTERLGARQPTFPSVLLPFAARTMDDFPEQSLQSIAGRLYPFAMPPSQLPLVGTEAGFQSNTAAVLSPLLQAGAPTTTTATATDDAATAAYSFLSIAAAEEDSCKGVLKLQASGSGAVVERAIHLGGLPPHSGALPDFHATDAHEQLLVGLLQSHAVGRDVCLIAGKGSGKSAMVRLFSERCGYATQLFSLFKDMTARDLLQRRGTDSKGNTVWADSPIVEAACAGQLAVLDGVHRLPADTLAVLQRLVQDREVELFDGTRLLPAARYDAAVAAGADLSRLRRIHPAFRIIALAEAPERESGWLTAETVAMFDFHALPQLSAVQQDSLLASLFPDMPTDAAAALAAFVEAARQSADLPQLSTRQIVRLSRHMTVHKSTALADLSRSLRDTLLLDFMPAEARARVEAAMADSGLLSPSPDASAALAGEEEGTALAIESDGDTLRIGDVSAAIAKGSRPELVPAPLFFDIPRHVQALQNMLKDIVAGERHLLLIGNQGVGKNKLVDRLCQLLQLEREYVQLHRDTTVQSLTLSPNLADGRVVWEDSPLVRAVEHGRLLMIDEVDKAPLEVVCVLKSLVEDGDMLLADGRRLVTPDVLRRMPWLKDKAVVIHPNFRVVVLANRPGYPFLGNNFFRECGDIFASHTIDNPDPASEMALLRAYAPTVDVPLLRSLTAAFRDLRAQAEDGLLSYPYSTRELVAIVKHLEVYPEDGLVATLENVLAFDAYDPQLRNLLSEVFTSHGIPLEPASRKHEYTVELSDVEAVPEPVRR